ncbi:MAG: tetratricopeptide repeat protein [Deltaproteobacteria bacterium]|nr:tetratricopeptide repeat protein [Deltaproteobacteria bacterium]MBW2070722.1 tetratricopeptide repeat protein [Deltaproteobacteria bacterium]
MPHLTIVDDPLSAEEHLKLGLAYEQKGDYHSAIREYTRAAREYPVAYLYMGNVYFLQENLPEAERHYRIAIQKLPDNPQPYNNLAWLYLSRRVKLEQAELLARKSVGLAPPDKKGVYLDTLEKILQLKQQNASQESY